MPRAHVNLRPGDCVEVLSPREILQTLDGDGTLDKLPFMPEMMEYLRAGDFVFPSVS